MDELPKGCGVRNCNCVSCVYAIRENITIYERTNLLQAEEIEKFKRIINQHQLKEKAHKEHIANLDNSLASIRNNYNSIRLKYDEQIEGNVRVRNENDKLRGYKKDAEGFKKSLGEQALKIQKLEAMIVTQACKIQDTKKELEEIIREAIPFVETAHEVLPGEETVVLLEKMKLSLSKEE